MKLSVLDAELINIYEDLRAKDELALKIGKSVHPNNMLSAINLVRYLIVRQHDLRNIHDALSEYGISSLRSLEGYVLKNVETAIQLVKLLQDKKWQPSSNNFNIGYAANKKILRLNANRLFNHTNRETFTEIMVTMPKEASTNKALIIDLINEGMEVARINTSHDNIDVWAGMITNINKAGAELDTPVKIYFDLAGPKIRTGAFAKVKKGKEASIKLKHGDHLIITKKAILAKSSKKSKVGAILRPAKVSTTFPDILDFVEIGHRMLFDDGKIESKVVKKNKDEVTVVITTRNEKGIRLKAEKGINIPDSHIISPPLVEADKKNLPFLCLHASIIGYSFVRTPQDVSALIEKLAMLGAYDVGIVLKIENKDAFENLPLILLEAMKWPKIGVMIARGDLAVELGIERIAEVQDEILWICEAAHVPVIWATQVFDNMSKKGTINRAEITDSATSVKAECVMLNKGPYIVQSTRFVKNILKKMESHTNKKKSLLRALKVAEKAMSKLEQLEFSAN